ncbi:hypothetical protein N7495_007120 [Penicillium taxi]|uniref:uncharacterized protein n=1 Tax=Penicillium taxi TaxID=168475 RepID=UPI0025451358|nr:uncharacterized protein N7495_007120 [Penicillium taxi]KAJ5895429.1 hypothetical protein N7495_007120 [Penicillium taxi]
MAASTSYNGTNSGIQVAHNYAPITANFVQLETSLNQACLRDLRTTNPYDDKSRIQNTSGGLFKDSYRWILDNDEFQQWQNNQNSQNSQNNRLLWIRGDPGKGKTMLLCGIIDELTQLHENTASVSFFFCQATDVRINSATSVLRGLIYLLVQKNPSLLFYVRSRYDQAGKALFEDINAWNALSSIFTDILKDPALERAYLIVDALDECTNGLRYLLDLIVQESSVHSQIKWIVSSRNWPQIIERLNIASQVAPISLELNDASVSKAVDKFIRHKVDILAKVKGYRDRIRDRIYHHLLLNSQGTFLWVALICQRLDGTPPRHAINMLEAFPPGLNALYGRMIDQVRRSQDATLLPDDDYDDQDYLSEIIAVCGSFLTLREDTITFVHQSAKDFLLREALNEILPRGIGAEHHIIFSRCLEVMFKTLRRDIFDIKLPGFSIKDVRQPSPNPLAAAEYACVYWIDHLQDSERNKFYDLSLSDRGRMDEFLQEKYLHWLEALSILGCISTGIQAMQKLEKLLQENANSQAIFLLAQDASRFIRYFRTAIESSPLQVYYSPLLFSPTKSLISLFFQKERPDWILNYPLVEESWSLCLHTLDGHSDGVNSIAWSPDGSRLASASHDKTVRIWDPATGQSVSTLEGHSGLVRSIAWSPDGSRLASASIDKTVRIWDPATGQSVSTLEGHSDWVRSIAWSPDGSRLASASDDKTVRIWDPATGQSVSTLEGHTNLVLSIAWSSDGSRLASASSDETVRIWDPATGQSVSTLHISSTHLLQFDDVIFNHLHTSKGTFDIGSVGSVTRIPYDTISSPVQYRYGLNHDDCWITYNGVNFIWLPSEYRPYDGSHFAMSSANLAIACSSGHIIFLALTEKNPILGV